MAVVAPSLCTTESTTYVVMTRTRYRYVPSSCIMSSAVAPKRSANAAAASSTSSKRFDRLLTILSKSLTRSRDDVASDAPHTIEECYGEKLSLFTSSDDGDGVTRLVDILLGKLDGAHDKLGPDLRKFTSSSSTTASSSASSTQFEKLLHRQDIQQTLQRIEDAINTVEAEEREFEETEAADRDSAKDAIKAARMSKMSPNSGKRKRIQPADSLRIRAYAMKLEYQQSLVEELDEIEKEKTRMEKELQEGWEEWGKAVEDVKTALDVMEKLGEGGDD